MTKSEGNRKILIIENDASLRKAIIDELTYRGFDAVGAEDGEKGLKLSLDLKPGLVLLDILMPKMDGIAVLKGLRANFGKSLPVIILTNVEPNDQLIGDIVDYQPSYYLVKSDIEIDDLVDKIKDTLKLDDTQYPRQI